MKDLDSPHGEVKYPKVAHSCIAPRNVPLSWHFRVTLVAWPGMHLQLDSGASLFEDTNTVPWSFFESISNINRFLTPKASS